MAAVFGAATVEGIRTVRAEREEREAERAAGRTRAEEELSNAAVRRTVRNIERRFRAPEVRNRINEFTRAIREEGLQGAEEAFAAGEVARRSSVARRGISGSSIELQGRAENLSRLLANRREAIARSIRERSGLQQRLDELRRQFVGAAEAGRTGSLRNINERISRIVGGDAIRGGGSVVVTPGDIGRQRLIERIRSGGRRIRTGAGSRSVFAPGGVDLTTRGLTELAAESDDPRLRRIGRRARRQQGRLPQRDESGVQQFERRTGEALPGSEAPGELLGLPSPGEVF